MNPTRSQLAQALTRGIRTAEHELQADNLPLRTISSLRAMKERLAAERSRLLAHEIEDVKLSDIFCSRYCFDLEEKLDLHWLSEMVVADLRQIRKTLAASSARPQRYSFLAMHREYGKKIPIRKET